MANDFSSTEVQFYEQVLENFDKDLDISNKISNYSPDSQAMQRHGDTFWRPTPYIAEVFDGLDLSGTTPSDLIDTQVPASLSYVKNVLWTLDSMENRDTRYVQEQSRAAAQQLSATVEKSCADLVALTGGITVKRGTLVGYEDLAEAEARFNEIGVPRGQRCFYFNTRDNNKVATNLSKSVANFARAEPASSASSIGNFANFDVGVTDLLPTLRDGSAGTGATVNGADQVHTPVANDANGALVDNRYQNLTLSSTASLQAGDRFTIAGVNHVHLISKQDTGQAFTNVVIEVINGTTIKCLAMVDSGVYQNVSAAPANSAAITVLNTTAAQTNVFWHESSLELVRGRIATGDLSAGGVGTMRGTTGNGIEIVMMKESSLRTTKTEYRFLIFYGTVNKNPLMNGVLLAGQA